MYRPDARLWGEMGVRQTRVFSSEKHQHKKEIIVSIVIIICKNKKKTNSLQKYMYWC